MSASGGSSSTMKVGDLTLQAVTKAEESGGMNAPSKKTQQGFSYTTRVDQAPKTATFEAFVTPDKYGQLDNIRGSQEPVEVVVGFVALGECSVDDVRIIDNPKQVSHLKVTIKVTQIQTPSTEKSTVTVDAAGGTVSSGADTGDLADPTLVRSQEQSASGAPSGGGGGGPIGDIAGWLGF